MCGQLLLELSAGELALLHQLGKGLDSAVQVLVFFLGLGILLAPRTCGIHMHIEDGLVLVESLGPFGGLVGCFGHVLFANLLNCRFVFLFHGGTLLLFIFQQLQGRILEQILGYVGLCSHEAFLLLEKLLRHSLLLRFLLDFHLFGGYFDLVVALFL
jgi:hypothetical protein